MNVITKIGIAQVGPFRKQVLDIPKGIVYLYGKNFLRDNGNGNAAGKSVFGSSVAEIFYDTPIVGTRQDRAKRGIRFVEFTRGKHTVRVQSAFKGKQHKLTVAVDGKDRSGRTNKNTKELIEKVWPVNELEYRTYGHLDSSKIHHLVGGSSKERKEFFTEFFGLNKLDAERKLVSGEISKLRRVGAVRDELQRTFDEVRGDMLTKADRQQKEEQAGKLRKRVARIRADQDAYNSVRQLVEFERYAGKKIKALKEIVPDLEKFEDVLESTGKLLKACEKGEARMEEWREYRRDLKRYEEAIAGIDMKTDLNALEGLSKDYLKAESKLEDNEGVEEPTKGKKPVKPETDLESAIAARVKLKHQLDHAKKFKTGKCYACGQDVDAEDPKKVEAKLAKALATIDEWALYERLKKDYDRTRDRHEEWVKDQAWIAAARHTVKNNKKFHELYQKRRSLPSRPEKVEKPEGLEDKAPVQAKFDLLKFFEDQIDLVRSLDSLTSEQRELKVDTEELASTQEKLSKLEAQLQVHKSVRVRANKLKARLDDLSEQMEDKAALELLYEGYSDKAVKRMVVDAINQHLMEAVNQYASIAFEDFRFEFVWGATVHMLVHRAGSETTDVRKLSGAEAKLFTITLLMALMKFVPKQKRLSMIVLDEPTASFSEQTTDLFHRLLPHLNKLIPTIMVITPKSSERLEGATELTVVRDAKGSRIVKGHPDEIT